MNLRALFKLTGKRKMNLLKINLLFIFIFLNIWDFVISREFINGMAFGLVMFGPVAFLWFMGTIKSVALLTLISIFEFTLLSIILVEGFELGQGITAKSLFWSPYFLMAAVNGFWGLKIYSEFKEEKELKIKN
ncbi:hypothetical protein HYU92_01840 [Candidatus Curtissbacteria bacterium]|nr:hypothetical protein [Candidatus Curtissbacteria bacterium]